MQDYDKPAHCRWECKYHLAPERTQMNLTFSQVHLQGPFLVQTLDGLDWEMKMFNLLRRI